MGELAVQIESYDAIPAIAERLLTITLDEAFEALNARLWDGELPPVMLLVHRSLRTATGGYYSPGRWRSRGEAQVRATNEEMVERDKELWKENRKAAESAWGDPNGWELAEIALNPESWPFYSDREILAVLAHEMAHHWQQCCGKPARNGYHNRQWGKEMKRIGLYPSNTGKPGGAETGTQMWHYILEGEPFAAACEELLSNGTRIRWEAPRCTRPPRAKSKVKFECPKCDAKAWAKPGAKLKCGVHDDVFMISEDEEE